jgi:cell wall-associated NlpC family hydrolase
LLIEDKTARLLRLTIAIAIVFAALTPSAALAAPGGVGTGSTSEATATPPPQAAGECSPAGGGLSNGACAPVKKARLIAGRAVAARGSLEVVKQVIEAANRIRTTPYVWGGGHARWWDRGYDCSGAVGYALRGGGLLEAPMTSGEMTRWGSPGKGRWITIYANSRHVFAVIAGLRWDTVGSDTETGPRWHEDMVSTSGLVARHPAGY